LPQAAPLPKVTPPAELRPASGLSIKVQSFRFAGNNLLSSDQLSPVVAEFVHRELSFDDLQRAADAVAAAYREAGWIVRVYLPEQDVSAGVITLQVVEARFAGVRMEGAPSKLVMASEIEAWFKSRQPMG
jgi:hemolysin activation/secretion protein